MVAIHTSEDIIRALREDPDLLDQVRRAVMTDEVLALPGQFAEMLETQNSMLETQNRILADLAETRQTLAETRQTQAEMLETQNRILADLAETRQTLAETRQTQAEMLEVQNRILADLDDTRRTVAEMLEVQNRTQNRILADLDDTRRTVAEMLHTQNRLLAGQDEMRQTISEMLNTQNRLLAGQDEMRGDIEELHGMYRRQHDDLANFRGNYSYDAAKKNSLEIAHLFVGLHGLQRVRSRHLTEENLGDMLDANLEVVEELRLRERAWRTFEKADLVAAITERQNSEPRFYISVEASYTGDEEDLLRATEHAKIIRRLTGLEAYAVVASVRLAPGIEKSVFEDVAEFLDANDEDVAFWYRLGESEPGPLPPR